MSEPDMLIQSQQVTLTGTVKDIEFLLEYLDLQRGWHRVTVTLTPASVPDATVGVTRESQQNSQQWISVDEQLPRVGKSVWIVYQGVVQTVAYRLAGRGFGCEDGYEWMTVPEIECDPLTDMEDVTHWMPLPEPPDAQGSVTEQSQQKSRQDGEGMTPRQLEILQHALGADQYGRRPRESRNYFCAGAQDEPDCRALVALGYMAEHGKREWLPYFNCSVTDAGINAMLRESPAPPKLTRSQKRYQEYLNADTGYSFKEWICSR